MIPVDELRCCNLFDQLNDRELEEVAKLGTIEKRGAGSRVIAEGTNAGALYMLKEGRVAVRMSSRDGNEVLIDELGPGSVFGWSAVLNNHIGYRVVRVIAGITADRLEKLRAKLVDQPFSRQHLVPARSTPVPSTTASSEMRTMPCPECSTGNRPFVIMNETEQYRCRNCGMIYYSPVGCETGPVTPSAERGTSEAAALGDNWSASTPRTD
jgi:hypothetical protein